MTEINSYDDFIDIRDVIAGADDSPELKALLEDCKGKGGDEQFEGEWYPVTLIRDSYFETYAQELAEDIGAVNHSAGWPNDHLDWKRAAEALQTDYTSVEFDGVTYWTR